MALSGDAELERAAAAGLHTLAQHQAPNGQIAKFVDLQRDEPDFWYLGCIDSTLWWLMALALLDRLRGGTTLRRRYARRIKLAIQWLLAQEHQRFFLLQQNEASDWADIMPRSGFVLYTNALWYSVKRLYRIGHGRETHAYFNGLFHPFSAALSEYRRARLLNDYVLRRGRNRDLYLSFVNFSFFGEEGDVFGNVLAVLLGLADERASARTLDALTRARVNDPYPVRAVTRPIKPSSSLWRAYMARHRQNFVWQYHNGGIWPMVGGFWISALVKAGRDRSGGGGADQARAGLRARELGLYRMAARQDTRAERHAGSILERRRLLDGESRRVERQDSVSLTPFKASHGQGFSGSGGPVGHLAAGVELMCRVLPEECRGREGPRFCRRLVQ